MTTNRTLAHYVSLLVVAFCISAQAATTKPTGTYHVVPPGTWQELFIRGGPGQEGNVISAHGPGTATRGDYYKFEGATLASVDAGVPDKQHPIVPEWDWVTTYTGGFLTLSNVPGAPWYNKKDSRTEIVYEIVSVINRTRSSRYDETSDDGRIDFDLTGLGTDVLGANVTFHATYSGVPLLAAGTIAGTSTTVYGICGELGSADISISR